MTAFKNLPKDLKLCMLIPVTDLKSNPIVIVRKDVCSF